MTNDAPDQQNGTSGDFVSRIETELLRTRKVLIFGDINDLLARDVLRKARYSFIEGEMLAVALEDRPGGLAQLTGRLAEAGVNITGLITLGRHQGKAELGISVDAVDVARRILATSAVSS